MRHFDCVDAGVVKGDANCLEIPHRVLVTNGVHTVAKRHVLQIESSGRLKVGSEAHRVTLWTVCASLSAVRSAAEVIMSRLPAYAGR